MQMNAFVRPGNLVSNLVVGGAVGSLVGLVNRHDDGPVGLQQREVGESLHRGAEIYGGIGAGLGALGGLTLGAKSGLHGAALLGRTLFGAVAGGVSASATGLSYQFAKNAID